VFAAQKFGQFNLLGNDKTLGKRIQQKTFSLQIINTDDQSLMAFSMTVHVQCTGMASVLGSI